MTISRFHYLLISLFFTMNMQGVPRFRVRAMETLVRNLSLQLPDSLPKAASLDSAFSYCNRPLRLVTNDLGDVISVGYRLFNAEWLHAQSCKELLWFLERYALEIDMPHPEMDEAEKLGVRNRVTFMQGQESMLKQIPDALELNVAQLPRRGIRLQASFPDGNHLALAVKADAQMIYASNLIEMEEVLIRDIQRRSSDVIPFEAVPLPWSNVHSLYKDDVCMYDAGAYLSGQIRSRLYTTRDNNGSEKLMCATSRPLASVGNILMTGGYDRSIPMKLVVDKYSFKQQELDVTLQQWLRQCQSEGCLMYVGYKSHLNETVEATLFALNLELGYNHVLSVNVPISLLSGKIEVVRAKLYAYVPLQNVVEDFFKNIENDEMEM